MVRSRALPLVWLVGVLAAACGGGSSGGAGDGGAGGPDGGGGPRVDGSELFPDAPPVPTEGARVFAPDVLHAVELTVAEGDLDTLDNDTSGLRVPCTISIDGEVVANAGIRKKGQTSRRPLADKPSFSVKVNAFVPGQKLDGLKKLALDASVQDASLVTGHIGYEVYRRVGLPAPRTSHGVVTFNGEVKGLYVLEEAVNQAFLEGAYGATNGAGNLYEGPWDFSQGAGAMELKDEVEEGRSRADLEALTAVVEDAPDGTLAADLGGLLDVDQFIVNYAVEVVALHWDSYMYAAWNFYLYHRPDTDRFVILPHGLNWPYWHENVDPYELYLRPWGPGTEPGELCVRLRDVPALDDAFHAAVRDVAQVGWDEAALLARLDQVEATINTLPAGSSRANDDLAAFNDAIDDARAFVTERKVFLTTLLGP